MKTLIIKAEFTYEPSIMHGNDSEAGWWFRNKILSKNLIVHENEDIGDDIGTLKIIEIEG